MKLNIFKIGNIWVFKEYFEKSIFKDLSDFYNGKRYRFEVKTKTHLEEIKKKLSKSGYNVDVINNPSDYCVVKDRYSKRKDILKKSVYNETKKDKVFFIMKDMAAVEEAVSLGAKRLEETNFEKFF